MDHLLARELRRAVDGARARDVSLAPRPWLARRLAREDIVGGDRDKPRTRRLACKCDVARALFVELEREISLRLAVVDLRHRRAVDNDVRRCGDYLLGERIRVGDVPFRQVSDNELIIADQFLLQGSAEHSLSAGYKNLHLASSFSLATRLACVIHAPRSTICQLM